MLDFIRLRFPRGEFVIVPCLIGAYGIYVYVQTVIVQLLYRTCIAGVACACVKRRVPSCVISLCRIDFKRCTSRISTIIIVNCTGSRKNLSRAVKRQVRTCGNIIRSSLGNRCLPRRICACAADNKGLCSACPIACSGFNINRCIMRAGIVVIASISYNIAV